MSISDEKYVAFTSYKLDGSAKSLPVWIVDLGDGRVGFTTASSSFKFKRVTNNPAVQLQPSNAKGVVKAGSAVVDGQAVAVTGAEFEPVRDKVKAKYGIQFRMINMVGRFMKLIRKGSGTDAAIIVTLD